MSIRPWTEWDHLLKIDPDKPLVDGETFEDVRATGTDAIEIGGTLAVAEAKRERVHAAGASYDTEQYPHTASNTAVAAPPTVH